MTTPTIHKNGDSQEMLYNQCDKALLAVRAAIDALHEMTPNGRNYYPQGPEAIGNAMTEHGGRLSKLYSVQDDLERMMEAIADSNKVSWIV